MPKRQPYNIVGTVGLIPAWKRNANRWATGETMVHLGRPAYCPRPPRWRAVQAIADHTARAMNGEPQHTIRRHEGRKYRRRAHVLKSVHWGCECERCHWALKAYTHPDYVTEHYAQAQRRAKRGG